MNEIARTVVISAVSGLIAFGGAVLYLGGEPSEPSLTPADVQSMIDSQPSSLAPIDAFNVAAVFAICADTADWQMHDDMYLGVPEGRARDLWQNANSKCWQDARERFYNVGK